ncbi:MAG: prepilin peptidase [Acidimicrobiales bacterium]
METLLVAGTAVAGLVIGGVLDPVGQQLADRSRREDERRRARSVVEEDEADGAASATGPARVGEGPAVAGEDHQALLGPMEQVAEELRTAAEEIRTAAAGDDADDPDPAERSVGNLLPEGPSRVRAAAAALVTAVLFGAGAAHFGRDLVLAPFCVLFALLVVVSVTDLTHRLVPRHLIYPALAAIVVLLVATSAFDHSWHDLAGSAIAGGVAFGIFFAIWWFVPRGMGFGDVRLAGLIGLTVGYLSLLHAYVAFLAGFVVGMLFGLSMMVLSSAGRKTRIPFAPSLAVGAVIAVLWGGQVAQSLFHAGT